MRVLRAHGSRPKYYHKTVGGNFRLDALQAAIVLAKLEHLDDWTAGRQTNAKRYDALFEASGLLKDGLVQLPHIASCTRTKNEGRGTDDTGSPGGHIFNQYVIRAPRRDELRAFLKEQGIGTEVYYPLPLHLQECFSSLETPLGSLPVSETLVGEVLSLPVFPELSEDQVELVATEIQRFYGHA